MIQCIRVYRVAVENENAFVAAMRDANLWRELSRHMPPGLIAADLLRSRALGSLYISIEFWHSERPTAKLNARRNMRCLSGC